MWYFKVRIFLFHECHYFFITLLLFSRTLVTYECFFLWPFFYVASNDKISLVLSVLIFRLWSLKNITVHFCSHPHHFLLLSGFLGGNFHALLSCFLFFFFLRNAWLLWTWFPACSLHCFRDCSRGDDYFSILLTLCTIFLYFQFPSFFPTFILTRLR